MQNLYKPKFSYIIPFRFKPDRVIPLRRVCDWLSGFQHIEVIIVEQDTHSKISNLNLKANLIFCESDAPFNKSWAYNVGFKHSNSHIVVFGDADFIMQPNDMIQSLMQLENYDCVIPTKNIVNLDVRESNADVNFIFSIKRISEKKNITDGISIYKRESIKKIAGWNEDFLGLGYSNRFQDLKIKRMLNYKEEDFIGYHFYHNPNQLDTTFTERNQNIINHYERLDSDLETHVNVTNTKIGSMNKYQH